MKGFSPVPALVCVVLLNWFGADLSAGAQPPTLDVSTDLTGLPNPYHEPVNMVPTTDLSQDSAHLLQDAIAFVVNWNANNPSNPYRTIMASQPGVFYFNQYVSTVANPTKATQVTYIFLKGLSNVIIDLQGSFLNCLLSYISAFTIDNCSNCIFENFQIDYQDLPFTQLHVLSVDTNSSTIRTVPESSTIGQPAFTSVYQLYQAQNTSRPLLNPATLYGFDFTRNGKPRYTYGRWTIQPPSGDSDTITVEDTPPYLSLIHPGDIFVVEARGGGPAIGLQSSSGLTLRGISIYSTGGVGIQTQFSPLVAIQSVSIEPPPATNRLVSTNAGGIAVNETAWNNSIANCKIYGTQDDLISGNSFALGTVQKELSSSSLCVSIVVIPTFASILKTPNPLNGMEVTFVDPSSASVLGSATIANNAPGPPYKPGTSIQLNLTQPIGPLPANALMFYAEPNYRGNGLIIEDNSISYNTLARGIALSGHTGVSITNNTLTSIQEAGIICGTGGDFGLLSNLTIANNTLNQTNLGTGVVGDTMLAAIQILTTNSDDDLILTQSNQNINMTNNQITGTPRTGIWVMNVSSGLISGNVLKHTGYNPLPPLKNTIPGQFNLSGAKAVLNSRTPVVIQSSNLTVVNNSYKP
jgi:Right handed beta helix region